MSSRPESHDESQSSGSDTARLCRVVNDSWDVIDRCLELLPDEVEVEELSRCRVRLDAAEARYAARQFSAGRSERHVEEDLAGDKRQSKSTVKKRARRGKAAAANPGLLSRMEAGTLSADQADVIAEAAERTEGAAALDEDLIDRIGSVPPDQGRRIANDYVRDRLDQDKIDDEHAQARRRRRVRRYTSHHSGLDVLSIEGSSVDINHIEKAIDALADRLYRQDGGRDTATSKHPRTRDQRRFDAAYQLIGNSGTGNSQKGTEGAGERGGLSMRRSTVFLTATIDQALGTSDIPITEIGAGPLPKAVVDRLACGAEWIGQIFSQSGELLWQGRRVKDPTAAQIRGLISRDKGCVNCGAHFSRCHVHHLTPWNSPAKGKTDIDGLALVCADCHSQLHEVELTLFRSDDGTWHTRSATPDEVAPQHKRRAASRRKPAADKKPTRDNSSHTGGDSSGHSAGHYEPGALW